MPQLSDAVVDRTLECLYSAATNQGAWPQALDAISVAFDAPRVAIMRTTPQMDGLLDLRQLDHGLDAEQQYREYCWSTDPALRLTRSAALGQWLDPPLLFDPRSTPEPQYMDFAIRHGIRWVAGGRLCGDTDSVVMLGLQRPRDHRPFDENDALAFRRLGSHIGRAATLSWALQQANEARALSIGVLDTLDLPVFAADSEGRVALANRRAQDHLRARGLLRLDGCRLAGMEPQSSSRLQAALKASAAGHAQVFSASFNAAQWVVRTVPLARHPGTTAIYVGCSSRAALDHRLLRKIFGFSDAEALVARQLVAGLRPKTIAARRNVAESTVRTQIRQILRKAGARRVADLGSLFSALPPVTDE